MSPLVSAPRVWQIIDSSGIGGIETHIGILTASLRRHGIDAHIVCYQDHGSNAWPDQLALKGLDVRYLDGTFRGLRRAMRADRPALVHLHGYKAGILGRIAAFSLAIPSITTFHMGEAPKFPVNIYAGADATTSLLSTRIAVSQDIQARLPFRSTVIPNYIDMPLDEPIFPLTPLNIGFIGRLSHEKAPDYFCELATRFRSAPAHWHIYGDGPMRAELEARFSDVVTFHGMVTDMSRVWSNLGLCVMPSRGEGLPLASIEALSHGVPLVAADVGDLQRVVIPGTSGWIAPAHQLNCFESAIRAWLQQSDIAKATLRQTCWRHAVKHFSERASFPQLLNVYATLGVLPASA